MMRSRYDSCAKVRVFMDYWNFAINWRDLTGKTPDKNLNWEKLPFAILDGLDAIPHLRNIRKELRGLKVYAAVKPCDHADDTFNSDEMEEERRFQTWLQHDLDQISGYTVDITTKSNTPLLCSVCNNNTVHFIEQGVDTKIAIDLVSLASRDLYDIAVLVTDDQDLVPSTQCVQDSIDKHVVHLGFKERKSPVRLETWGHLFVENMLSSIAR